MDVFNIDLSTVKRVETNDDTPKQLSISDIKVGDKIIARGYIQDKNLNDVEDIISFSYVQATTTATSTATTTDATSTNMIDAVVNTVSNTFQNIVNAVTGASSTPDTSSSTQPPVPVSPDVTLPSVDNASST